MIKMYSMLEIYRRFLESEGWQVLISMEQIERPTICHFKCQYEGDNSVNNYSYTKIYDIDVYVSASKKLVVMVHE